MSKRRIALYYRVSTDAQGESGLSLQSQRKRLRAYADAIDAEVVGEWHDVASAKTVDRPGLAAALASGADALVVTSLDRLTRSVRDLGDLLEGRLRTVGLVSLGESVDTASAAGRLVLNVLVSVAQWEREAIGERTRRALATKRARGENVGRAPYGWRAIGGTLVRDEVEQRVIEAARALRAEGRTLAAIGGRLEELGHLPRSGKPWDPKQIDRMLRRS